MTHTQKVIKYIAMALAFIIIASIISLIINFMSNLNLIKTSKYDDNGILKKGEYSSNINKIDIELNKTNIIIKPAKRIKLETDNTNLLISNSDNELIIREKKSKLFLTKTTKYIILYLPNNKNFSELEIDNGVGNVEISDIVVNNLSLELGAGKAKINNISVTGSTDIDGGAGNIDINNSHLHNLKLDMGVGHVSIVSVLSGNNKIEAGVGKIDLLLQNGISNYQIKVDKGLGSVRINDEEIKNNTIYGDGNTNIDIDGGIGSIVIK